MSNDFELDASHMARALELAARGQGSVEPNPMVGCVIERDGEIVGEGYHQRFGGDHAEVQALKLAGAAAAGATVYLTLEPCCHHGKTPPCTQALIAAGVRRVVVAMQDPFEAVSGKGIAELAQAGVQVEVGLLEGQARAVTAPFRKLLATGRPWLIAKWAMTLDGKTATATGDSRWISSSASREIVHAIRGRVDAIMVGRGTAWSDDPLLTARPPGPRKATRIVVDTQASLDVDSQLVLTARDTPVLVAASEQSPSENRQRLTAAGCEVLLCPGSSPRERLAWLLDELGRRRMTNLLVEGGGQLLGTLFDMRQVDEVHAFIATRLVGGQSAPAPIGGQGLGQIASALELVDPTIEVTGGDIYVRGRLAP
ncbi:MAG TPA: bifunctional diaminohydroxyphosphoribosylaminopyrimidine deaminase/5-amino-6-(5-phosphoribosylamino)uracil reductase RibD [Pirellulales bacterium]|nr:bifunctional diaminohydroxyphosphoribosylaminopyrimidine deaminase/5-amino-6-(5-phosphoribosylamino)uracil reductase RibD [Pirellulales bacterium]